MPQNAARMNQLQIREQQQLNRERKQQDEAEEQRRQQAMQKTKQQYSHVASHGYGRVSASGAGSSSGAMMDDDAEIRVFIRECDGEGAQQFQYRESEGLDDGAVKATRTTTTRPAPGPAGDGAGGGTAGTRSRSRGSLSGAQPRGSVEGSGAGPARSSLSSSSVNANAVPPASTRGKVPKYLVQRKAELAAEKDAIAAEAARREELGRIPPGHRFVSEQEKAETLVKLAEREKELQTQLAKIPIRFDTESIKTRRRNIEEELRQIEAAKVKYGTAKPLYVPL